MRTSKSKKIQDLVKTIDAIAISNANILISGESGTGKEYMAKHIHFSSRRAHQQFVSINCAAIPESLLESELFGHKKGAFTGAFQDYAGLFEQANGGTVFLDEIGDMPLALQAKILRVLQERKIRPVGGGCEKPVDFRLISATHRDLKNEIALGRFREDLFYRLNVIPIFIPPLRQRIEDIPVLINRFSKHFSEMYGISQIEFSADTMEELCSRKWQGNIRELENLVEQITVLNRDKSIIQKTDLPSDKDSNETNQFKWFFDSLKNLPSLSELTREYIDYVLQHENYHQGEAALTLGISRRTIYRKIKSELSETIVEG